LGAVRAGFCACGTVLFWEERMDSGQVKDKVVDIICQKLDVAKEKVNMETRYTEDLGADSLDQAELVMEFEDEFDINIPDDAEGKIKTVGETVKFIEEQISKK
jgi:acyl carrier protein